MNVFSDEFNNFLSELVKETIKISLKEIINENKPKEKVTLTINEAAKLSGIGRDKLMELAHSQNSDFPCFKVGSKFLINRQMLIEWLDKLSKEKRVL